MKSFPYNPGLGTIPTGDLIRVEYYVAIICRILGTTLVT